MSTIQTVLQVLSELQGQYRLEELSQKTGIQPAALRDILQFCVRKGLLEAETDDAGGCLGSCSAHSCAGCGHKNMPALVRYRLPHKELAA